jgi:sugar (glycoside-pentoside-hexuronide) transporter
MTDFMQVGRASRSREWPPSAPSRAFGPRCKIVYATGDFTLTTALACLSLIYAGYFLTQVVGLRPALAGLVPLIGRTVDAVTDPLFGHLSDRTNWRGGRRRPYFLLGAVPFGLSFALLWLDLPLGSQAALFAYHVTAYCAFSLCLTVLAVPYFAIQPEMVADYDGRTSLNTYRGIGAIAGLFAAIGFRPLAERFGGEPASFFATGLAIGLVLALPWFAVHRVTFEHPAARRRPAGAAFLAQSLSLLRRRSFRLLVGLFLSGRIAIDLLGTLMVLYMAYWIGRSEDFEIVMLLFLLCVAGCLPLWLGISRRTEKSTAFVAGALCWMAASLVLFLVEPDWPRWTLFLAAPLLAVGYAVVDLMPFAMLGDVVDEDDLQTGMRREGLYFGVFTLVRKLGGALAVFLALVLLDLLGFVKGQQQSELVREGIHALAALGPVLFLALAVWIARRYPLTRARHREILERLELGPAGASSSGAPARAAVPSR